MKILFQTLFLVFLGMSAFSQETEIEILVNSALEHSKKIKINELNIQRSVMDKQKAYQAYLPKITAEWSFTYLNDDVRLPADMENLLSATQMLLIKEQTAMKMAGLAIPDAQKVNFASSYEHPTLKTTISQNFKDVPPIQYRDIMKCNVSAQMILFSGLKVPYSIKAANHQIEGYKLLNTKETTTVIYDVATTYYRLALMNKSNSVLDFSEKMLEEQAKYVTSAQKAGLAIELDVQKINIARQQLKSKRIEINGAKEVLLSRLSQLTGKPVDSLQILKPELKEIQIFSQNYDLTQRGDVKSFDEFITATNYKANIEKTEYYPKVVAFARKEFLTSDLSTFDPEWYVGVAVRWTIFDGLTAAKNVQQARIDRDILQTRKDEALELLQVNIRRLQSEQEKNKQLFLSAKEQMKLSQDAMNLTKKQREVGLATTNDYLQSLTSYENAYLEMLKIQYQMLSIELEILEATGQLNINSVK